VRKSSQNIRQLRREKNRREGKGREWKRTEEARRRVIEVLWVMNAV